MQVKVANIALREVLKNYNDVKKLVQLCEQKTFRTGEIIAQENEMSAIFFIIEGIVNCYKKSFGSKAIDTLTKRNVFGDEIRLTKTYMANSEVKCLCLPRKEFGIIFKKDNNTAETYCNTKSMSGSKIGDFEIIRVLGKGSFSTVKLAKFVTAKDSIYNPSLFAIKCFKNKHPDEINRRPIKELIETEIQITSQLESPFIVRSFGSFESAEKKYFVLEAMEGGDLFTLLELKSKFTEDWIRFFTASVLHAFTDIHSKNVVYRDLKPENIMLSRKGYIKIIDFGLAKKLIGSEKTYTCCGTVSRILMNFFS